MSKIVFITVCRNDIENLKITVTEVKKFLSPSIRYIVIDGDSSDGTAEYLDWLRSSNPHVSFISEPDDSIYDAMNKGWNLCNDDDYICFLGAGDYPILLPTNLQLSQSDAYYGLVRFGHINFKMSSSKLINMFTGNYLHHQGLLIKKGCLRSPFNTSYKVYADYDLNLRLLSAGVKFKKLNDFVVYADPFGLSADPDITEMLTVIKSNNGPLAGAIFIVSQILKRIRRCFYES